ncbi:MAG: preprotein translocase subunit SecY [Candidatus Omnitrophica bacterium]|nr:preprotein translocase subunit SecY [Candidatus Omnitrophota bacterium]
MLNSLANIFKVEELRKKVLITFALIFIYRMGCFIPTPGVDGSALSSFFEELARKQGANLFGFINIFTGGALKRLSVFALGVMPYISASIIMQLLTAVIPGLEKMAKEGKSGYEKINQFTRYGTVVLCIIQGFFLALWLENKGNFFGMTVVPYPGWLFRLTTIITLATGTLFIMWLGEQIQERGIGNGISLIIAASILSRLPESFYQLWVLYSPFNPAQRQINTFTIISLLVLWLLVVVAVVLFSQAQRRIPVQYARRVVGRRVYGGQSTYLPIRIDMAGVIAMIFAQSVLLFPSTLANFFPKAHFLNRVFSQFLHVRGLWYNLVYVLLVLFFMYFYTAIVFNPVEIANNLRKYGGFVPGIRPGENTAKYLDYVATRLVFAGAVYISLIAILPTLIMMTFKIPSYAIASFFGGTTILIFVGVMLDTMRQIESQLLLHHYQGFMKKGKLKGRR